MAGEDELSQGVELIDDDTGSWQQILFCVNASKFGPAILMTVKIVQT